MQLPIEEKLLFQKLIEGKKNDALELLNKLITFQNILLSETDFNTWKYNLLTLLKELQPAPYDRLCFYECLIPCLQLLEADEKLILNVKYELLNCGIYDAREWFSFALECSSKGYFNESNLACKKVLELVNFKENTKDYEFIGNCFGLKANNYALMGKTSEALANRSIGQHFFQKFVAQKNPFKKPPKGIREAYEELERRRALRENKMPYK